MSFFFSRVPTFDDFLRKINGKSMEIKIGKSKKSKIIDFSLIFEIFEIFEIARLPRLNTANSVLKIGL